MPSNTCFLIPIKSFHIESETIYFSKSTKWTHYYKQQKCPTILSNNYDESTISSSICDESTISSIFKDSVP